MGERGGHFADGFEAVDACQAVLEFLEAFASGFFLGNVGNDEEGQGLFPVGFEVEGLRADDGIEGD